MVKTKLIAFIAVLCFTINANAAVKQENEDIGIVIKCGRATGYALYENGTTHNDSINQQNFFVFVKDEYVQNIDFNSEIYVVVSLDEDYKNIVFFTANKAINKSILYNYSFTNKVLTASFMNYHKTESGVVSYQFVAPKCTHEFTKIEANS